MLSRGVVVEGLVEAISTTTTTKGRKAMARRQDATMVVKVPWRQGAGSQADREAGLHSSAMHK